MKYSAEEDEKDRQEWLRYFVIPMWVIGIIGALIVELIANWTE